MLPPMVDSVRLLKERICSVVAILGCAPEIEDRNYHSYLKESDIIPLRGKVYDIMGHSDALVVTSGTATVEAGILGTPMIIVYRTSLLTYIVGRSLIGIQNIGLINIVAGARVVPELRQDDVTHENISSILEKLLRDKELYNTVKHMLQNTKNKLGTPGAADRAAKIALEMLK